MISSYASLTPLLVPNGSNVSNVLNGAHNYHDAIALALYGDGTYGAETFTLEGNANQDATNATAGWVTIQGGNPLADLIPPVAGKMATFQELIYAGSLRIKASGNVVADRSWSVNKIWTT